MRPSSVTHLILTYNDIGYLKRAINLSISSKGLKNIQKEILIVDDGSFEPVTPKLKKIYDFNLHNIRVIRNKKNMGINASVEIGLNQTNSLYIHLGSSNDILCPTFFQESIEAFQKNSCAAFAFSDPGVFDEKNNIYQKIPLLLSGDEIYFTPDEFCLFYKSFPFHIGSNTILFKTHSLKEVGIQKNLNFYGDWFLSYFLAFSKGCIYIPKTLTYLTLHPNPFSKRLDKKKRRFEIKEFLLEFYGKDECAFERLRRSEFMSAFPFPTVLSLFFFDSMGRKIINFSSLLKGASRFFWHCMINLLPIRKGVKIQTFIRKRILQREKN